MTSEYPPAFRSRAPEPAAGFIGLTDEQVLKIASAAFTAAQLRPVGSTDREAEWARFDDAMAELAARGMRHVLAKLHERGQAGDGPS